MEIGPGNALTGFVNRTRASNAGVSGGDGGGCGRAFLNGWPRQKRRNICKLENQVAIVTGGSRGLAGQCA